MNLQIIISGIGGQGVLFATKVLSEAALASGENLIGSETHGMSQRGGSVISHLKIGPFRSPLIRTGTTDIIYGLEQTEFLRALPFIKKGGACFVNTPQNTLPDKKLENYCRQNKIVVFYLDADKIAREIGSPLSANLVILGYSCAVFKNTSLFFNQEDTENTIKRISPNKVTDMNLKAFLAGFQAFRSPISHK